MAQNGPYIITFQSYEQEKQNESKHFLTKTHSGHSYLLSLVTYLLNVHLITFLFFEYSQTFGDAFKKYQKAYE